MTIDCDADLTDLVSSPSFCSTEGVFGEFGDIFVDNNPAAIFNFDPKVVCYDEMRKWALK